MVLINSRAPFDEDVGSSLFVHATREEDSRRVQLLYRDIYQARHVDRKAEVVAKKGDYRRCFVILSSRTLTM